MKRLLARLRGVFGARRRDAQLDAEIGDHLERLAQEYRRRGLSVDEAQAAARRDFGGVDQMREHYRDQRGIPIVEALMQDIRYALRGFRKSPGFVIAVVASLGAGIGVTAVVFTVLNAVMLTSLPVRHAEELVVLVPQVVTSIDGAAAARFSYPAFTEFNRAAPAAGSLVAVSRVARMYRRDQTQREPQLTRVQLVSGNFFSVLGVAAVRGRVLSADDDQAGSPRPVAVMSHAMWSGTFGSDPDIIGRTLTINGGAIAIVGVAPEGFSGVWLETPADVWVPVTLQGEIRYRQNYSASNSNPLTSWIPQEGIRWLNIIGRVPAVDRTQANAALSTEFHRLVGQPGLSFGDPTQRERLLTQRLMLRPFGQGFSNVRATFSVPLYVLFGMSALILLIACANAANLLLARATARRREIGVRLSLGASRGRVIRQLLTESALLAAIACVVGLVIAGRPAEVLVSSALGSAVPFTVAVSGRVVAFGAVAAGLTVLLAGLAPALRTTKVTLGDALRAGGTRGATAQPRLQRVLVATQVALSLMLVVAAGLFAQTLRNYTRLDLGFAQEHVISVSLNLVAAAYPVDRLTELSRRLIDRVDALPGVLSASTSMCGLADGCRDVSDVTIEGYQPAPGESVQVQEGRVSTDYFATTGMRMVEGRAFTRGDRDQARRVAIVNRAFARRFTAGRSPLGRHFDYGTIQSGRGARAVEIVGVVEDVRFNRVQDAAMPMVFYPMEQGADPEVVDVRTAGDPRALVGDLRRAIVDVAPDVPIASITILSDRVARNLSQERLVATLTSIFGVLAVSLAALGLFSILSYGVTRRTSEFGIRMALGAGRSNVIAGVLREALMVVLGGLIVGIPTVFAASRVLRTLLFGITATDLPTLAGGVMLLVATAVIAASVPAWRASRVDPVVALRQD